ncbi:MAG: hypothetical protein JRM80_05295 [Nitrososphaerota archaeon]|nr:hypothetical protein [Nitrososphaerota archaeon]
MGFSKTKAKLAKAVLTSTALIAVLNLPSAFAISGADMVSAGSIWLETTIAVAMVFVTAMAFSLQISRGYFLRVLDKFTLRLGADIWWLAYVLIRDGLIFIAFVMSLMVFFPGTFLDYPIAVPFMPLSAVLFGTALVTKLYFDADDNRNVFRFVTVVVFLGTVSWIFGTVFITETPLALSTLPAGVSSTTGFWAGIYNSFSSTQNLGLAMASFYGGFGALGVIALIGLAHPLLHSRMKAKKFVGGQASTASPSISVPVPTGRVLSEPQPVSQAQSVPRANLQASASPSRDRVDYIA